MKACVLKSIGNLSYEDVPMPVPYPGEVLLKIHSCGICSSDIDRIFRTGTYHFPTIPGHEFSGEVVALGEGVDDSYLDKRAAVFPLLPCFQCPSCAEGEYARCDSYSYFGSRCDGAYAEYLAVPVWNLELIPDGVSYDAAAMCEPAAVAFHAVNAARIKEGDTVAVIGSGTIGLLAAMLARIWKADRVIVAGRGEKKLMKARELGFADTVSSLERDIPEAIRALTNGQGADAVLEMAGSPETVRMAVQAAKKGGTIVLTGNPSGDIALERSLYWRILRCELTLRGTWNSSYGGEKNDWDAALGLMRDGQLPVEKLITHKFPLKDYGKAFDTLRDRNSGAVKVIFAINDQ